MLVFLVFVLAGRALAFRTSAVSARRRGSDRRGHRRRDCLRDDDRLRVHDLRAGLQSVLFLQLSRRPSVRMLTDLGGAIDDHGREEVLIDDDGAPLLSRVKRCPGHDDGLR